MDKFKRTFGFILSHSLGKRHPLRSLLRFAWWQIQCLLQPSGLIVKDFLPPVKFYARKGLTGITGNIYTGLHEFNDMAFLLHVLLPGDYFVDAGANVGSYALLASGVSGANSIAVEPVTGTFELLQKNIELNNLQDRVVLHNAGVGAASGNLIFTADQDTTNHVLSSSEKQPDTINVPMLTIDSFIIYCPLLIKIDVEGYETEVLKGMSATIKDPALKAIIIELNGSGERYGFDEKQIHELLLSNGFKPYAYHPFTRSLTEISVYGSTNTIYCRDLEFINERIKRSKPIKLMGETI